MLVRKGNILLPLISAVAIVALLAAGYFWYQNQRLQKGIESREQGKEKPTQDRQSCKVDSDCSCGVNKENKECAWGNKQYIDSSHQCPDFCGGFSGTLNVKCISNKCSQVSQDETANWKTYTNSEIGFQLKYPDTMYFQEQSTNVNPGPIIPFGQLIETKYQNQQVHNPFIGFNLTKTNLSPQEWEKQRGTPYSFIGLGNAPKSIDPSQYYYSGVANLGPYRGLLNVEAIRFDSEGTSYGLTHTIWKLKNGYLIDIYKHTSGLGEIPTSIYDQILGTFKFL